MTDAYYTIARAPVAADINQTDTIGVRLSGEFDLGARDDLRAALLGAIAEANGARILVDLAEVGFLDSETLRVLLDCRSAAQRQGTDFRVTNAHGVVRRVLDVTGLAEILA